MPRARPPATRADPDLDRATSPGTLARSPANPVPVAQGGGVTGGVLLLVAASAAIHVAWNVLARSARRTASFPWLVNVAGAAVLLPFFLWRRIDRPLELDAALIGLAALSALFEAAYFLLLQAAYGASELSIVYPLSRGIAPLLALLPARAWSGDEVSARELGAILVVLAGTVLVARSGARVEASPVAAAPLRAERAAAHPSSASGAARARRGVALALLVGGATAAYQLVDRRAMQLAPRGSELDFLFTMQAFLAALMTGWWSLTLRARRAAAPAVAPRVASSELRVALLAALGIQAAYFLILLALRDGNVTLVAAARNVGIPMSLLAGALLLRERVDGRRAIGATLIAAGVALSVG